MINRTLIIWILALEFVAWVILSAGLPRVIACTVAAILCIPLFLQTLSSDE